MTADQQASPTRQSPQARRPRLSSALLIAILSAASIVAISVAYSVLSYAAATCVATIALTAVVGAGTLMVLRQQRRLHLLSQAVVASQKENLQKITRTEYHTRESTRLLSSQIYRVSETVSQDSAQIAALAERLEKLQGTLDTMLHDGAGDIGMSGAGVVDRIQHEHNTQALERFLAHLLAGGQRPSRDEGRE